jgi:hypothetical protein
MNKPSQIGIVFLTLSTAASPLKADDATASDDSKGQSGITLGAPKTTLWESGVGEGFQSSTRSLALEAGASQGLAILGSVEKHDLALMSLSYGHMLGHTKGVDRFYRGNWELRAELFGGVQFSPKGEWELGLAPHLRYNFATGTRIIPFIDAGAGVTATSIGPPDLSNTFEFNLQGTVGTHWFIRDDLALTIDARYPSYVLCRHFISQSRSKYRHRDDRFIRVLLNTTANNRVDLSDS